MTPWAALIEPNWREMAIDLMRAGFTDITISVELGVPVSTYQAWKYGRAKPGYMNGIRFVVYYEAHRNTKS